MSLYTVLGVRQDASAEALRRAYLTLAREHHPDSHVVEGDRARRAADHRMREINGAWAVLGEPARRALYDRTIAGLPDAGQRGARPATRTRSPSAPSTAWRPYDAGDPGGDEASNSDDDCPPGPGSQPAALVVGPVGLLLAGAVGLASGVLLGSGVLAGIGLALLGLAAVLFVAAPLVALSRSRH